MKTKLIKTLLFVGLSAGCLVGVAQDKPADNSVQKLYNQPAGAAKTDAAPAEATAGEQPAGDVLPLVQFEDAPLVDVIKTLARQANLNIVFDPKVTTVDQTGKSPYPPVSIRLENVTAQNVLEAVLNNNNLRLEKDPKTKIARVTVKEGVEPLITKIYQLKYSSPSNLVNVIKPTLGARSQVIPDGRTSQLIVLATEKELLELDPLMEKLDTETKQVLIEARILETQKTPETTKGINWEKTFGGQNFAFGNNLYEPQAQESLNNLVATGKPSLLVDTARGFNPATAFLDADGVKGVLSWFNKDNETEVIATPRAVTTDNTPTTLSVTRALPIFKVTAGGTQTGPTVDITYTNIGIILNVTPRISANDSIALKVIPEVSNVEETKDLQTIAGLQNSANIYAIRRIETQVLIPSGNTLVMGGLISDNLTKTSTKVPILGDLPGLGLAFRSKDKKRDKRNLIIFITPTIVTDDDFAPTQSDFLKKKAPADRPDSDEAGFDNLLDSAKPHDWSKPVY